MAALISVFMLGLVSMVLAGGLTIRAPITHALTMQYLPILIIRL